MSRFDRNSTYLAVRRWIDHDIAHHHHRSPSVQISCVMTSVLLMALIRSEGWLMRLALTPLVLFGSICSGFVLWRASRIVRAFTIKGDRAYDQKGKFMLPLEYARSESATASARRKRASRRR